MKGGYLDDDDVITGSADTTDHPADSSINSTEADDDAGAGCQPIPDFEQPCAEDMTRAIFPTDGHNRDAGADCRTDQSLYTTIHGKYQSSLTLQRAWLEQSHI